MWKIAVKQWPGRGKEESSVHPQTGLALGSPFPTPSRLGGHLPCFSASFCVLNRSGHAPHPFGGKERGAACGTGIGEGVTGEQNELVLREAWRPDWQVSFILFQFSKSLN